MMRPTGVGGVGGLGLLLLQISAGDLHAIDGAFGRSEAEWRVMIGAAGVLLTLLSALLAVFAPHHPLPPPPDQEGTQK